MLFAVVRFALLTVRSWLCVVCNASRAVCWRSLLAVCCLLCVVCSLLFVALFARCCPLLKSGVCCLSAIVCCSLCAVRCSMLVLCC